MIPSIPLSEQKKIVKHLYSIDEIIKSKKLTLSSLDELIKSRFIEMFGMVESKKELIDLCDKITDGSHLPPKGIEKSEYLMLSSQNVYDELVLDDVRYLSKEDFEKENKRTDIQPNDVLLTIVGTIGRTHVVKHGENYVFQRSVGVIKPKQDVLNGTFLSAYLQTLEAQRQLESGGHGTSQKGIYLNDLKKLKIPCVEYQRQLEFEMFKSMIDKSKFPTRFH